MFKAYTKKQLKLEIKRKKLIDKEMKILLSKFKINS